MAVCSLSKGLLNTYMLDMRLFLKTLSRPPSLSQPVYTAFGPFAWDKANQRWTNLNNGMRMTNREFQDMILLDYTMLDSGSQGEGSQQYGIIPNDWGVIRYIPSQPLIFWSGLSTGTPILLNGINVQFINLKSPIRIVASSGVFPTVDSHLYHSLNGGSATQHLPHGVTVMNNDSLRFGVLSALTLGITGGAANVNVMDTTNNRLLAILPVSRGA